MLGLQWALLDLDLEGFLFLVAQEFKGEFGDARAQGELLQVGVDVAGGEAGC